MSAYRLAIALGLTEADQYEWQLQAACKGDNPDHWHPGQGAPTAHLKRKCHACPVEPQCLQWALDTDAPGICGGTSQKQRDLIRRGQPQHTCRITDCERNANGAFGCCLTHAARIRRWGNPMEHIPVSPGGHGIKRETG